MDRGLVDAAADAGSSASLHVSCKFWLFLANLRHST